LGRIDGDGGDCSGKAEEGFQMQGGVANLDGIAVAEQEALVIENAEIGREVMKAPKGLGSDFAGGERKDKSADVPFVVIGVDGRFFVGRCAGSGVFPGDETGDTKGEKQGVFIEEVDGDLGASTAEVEGGRRSEAEGGDGDGDVRGNGGLFWSAFFLLFRRGRRRWEEGSFDDLWQARLLGVDTCGLAQEGERDHQSSQQGQAGGPFRRGAAAS
jgi:hypothetical protein